MTSAIDPLLHLISLYRHRQLQLHADTLKRLSIALADIDNSVLLVWLIPSLLGFCSFDACGHWSPQPDLGVRLSGFILWNFSPRRIIDWSDIVLAWVGLSWAELILRSYRSTTAVACTLFSESDVIHDIANNPTEPNHWKETKTSKLQKRRKKKKKSIH